MNFDNVMIEPIPLFSEVGEDQSFIEGELDIMFQEILNLLLDNEWNHDVSSGIATPAAGYHYQQQQTPTSNSYNRTASRTLTPMHHCGSQWYRSPPTYANHLVHRHDVLSGRGHKVIIHHEGNLWLRRLVSEHLEQYFSIPTDRKREKTAMIREIVNTVEARGGRFLEPYAKGTAILWKEMGYQKAQEKIGQLFRDERGKQQSVLSHRVESN